MRSSELLAKLAPLPDVKVSLLIAAVEFQSSPPKLWLALPVPLANVNHDFQWPVFARAVDAYPNNVSSSTPNQFAVALPPGTALRTRVEPRETDVAPTVALVPVKFPY